ncbi:alpha-hydroxy-acid oxidizing protein [Acetobacter sp. TBRC 12305]|uniref:Alpha-hydroxy-acid oxidizing protein n=1 Tax=Acetobacter garciniae TaxID=2817435 RepID=A0A939HIM1_9PROT|nr:alpha-hydroxy acid oxidase [Acetobacter garciniae]MBO1325100.1 alpha-hydroxy-acid oxidizing protein [Acetobacter garciniae]MBX0344929.1 alpha-hydroxy-acid oxidizing protein [Acetobacter garciniae]
MIISANERRRVARNRLPRWLFDYIDGGAGAETTLRRNTAALDRIGFVPFALRGAAEPSLKARVLGLDMDFPVALAPVGMAGLVSPVGEIAAARAAVGAGSAMCVSSFSLAGIEQIAASVDPARLMFQLYVFRDRAVTQDMLCRVWAAGIRTLVVTVDTPITPMRERDARNGFRSATGVSPRLAGQMLVRPRWLYGALRRSDRLIGNLVPYGMGTNLFAQAAAISRAMDPGLDWDDMARLRAQWKGRLVIKGVLHPQDTARAAALGVDGVVLSNHGGRQLDGAISAIEALPASLDAAQGRVEVCVDGGFRSGGDIIKALALGASAVWIGRPWVYGLATAGGQGVADVLASLRDGMRSTMTLLGAADLATLRASRAQCLQTESIQTGEGGAVVPFPRMAEATA